MLCKCYWIMLYIVHVTAFCLVGPFFSGHGVVNDNRPVRHAAEGADDTASSCLLQVYDMCHQMLLQQALCLHHSMCCWVCIATNCEQLSQLLSLMLLLLLICFCLASG